MTAGATGTIVTNPLWVIKTRFMVSLYGFVDFLSSLSDNSSSITSRHKNLDQAKSNTDILGTRLDEYTKLKD